MNPENTPPANPSSQQPVSYSYNPVSNTEPPNSNVASQVPQPAIQFQQPAYTTGGFNQEAQKFRPSHLALVLFIMFAVAGVSIAVGVRLIDKNQQPFQAPSSNGSVPTNWVSFSSDAGHFSAMFPTTPAVMPQTTQAGQQGGSIVTNGYQSGNEKVAYAVEYITYSSDYTLSSDSRATLKGLARREMLQLHDAKLVSENSISISGYPAETYEITGTRNGKNLTLTGELVLNGHVLYNVSCTQINSQAPSSQYFLNNFKVNNNEQ